MPLIENRFIKTKKEMAGLVFGKRSGKLGVDPVYITNLDKKGRLVWATVQGQRLIDLVATAERAGLQIKGINYQINGQKNKSGGLKPIGGSREDLEKKKIREQHRKLKIENDKREGKLIDAEGARDKVFELARSTRDAVMIVPGRIASKCVGKTAFEIDKLMSEELSNALGSLLKGL